MNDLYSTHYGWLLATGRTDYKRALAWQHSLVKMRREGIARDTILILEHPPVITVGRDGHDANYSECKLEPVFIERGGDVTYHGPGQLVAYFIFNLTRHGRDLHKFMENLQQGIVDAFAEIGITAAIREGDHRGVWVEDKKIASVGVAVKNWITFHGVATNLNTDLKDFLQINPCGLESDVMTSASQQLGKDVDLDRFSQILVEQYARLFVTEFEPVELEELDEVLESQSGGYEI